MAEDFADGSYSVTLVRSDFWFDQRSAAFMDVHDPPNRLTTASGTLIEFRSLRMQNLQAKYIDGTNAMQSHSTLAPAPRTSDVAQFPLPGIIGIAATFR